MKIFRQIEKVQKYVLFEDNLFYQSEKSIYKNNNVIIELDKNFFGEFYINDGKVVIQSFYGNFQIDNISYKGYYNYLNNNNISYLNTKDGFMYFIENEESKRLNIEKLYYDFGNAYILNENSTIIHAYTLPTAQPLWQFDLGVLGTFRDSNGETQAYEVRQFVGVYESVLWVFLNSNEMLGFDLHTGSVKQHLKGVKNENVTGKTYRFLDPESHHIFYNTDYILDTENGKIIGLLADRFYEIDLKTSVIEPKLYGLWEKMETIGIDKNNVHRQTVLQGNELYFLCINQHKFVILDIVTKEITYQSEKIEVAEKSGTFMQLKNLQVSNDKVYILDSANTLHIFQKENPSI